MKTLTLPLKKKWFDMIKSGVKKEEYRLFNEYWYKRFCKDNDGGGFYIRRDFDRLVFTLGYPKADDKERRLEFKNPKIRVAIGGNAEWGAIFGVTYFVITWEEK